MNDPRDELVEKLIELEKQQGLRYLDLHPISTVQPVLPPGTERGTDRGVTFHRYWVGAVALLFLMAGFAFLLPWRHAESPLGISSSTVELALHSAAARASNFSPPFLAVSSGGPNAEMAWTIELAFCRMQALQYSHQDLDRNILQALLKTQSGRESGRGWDQKLPGGLDRRIKQLSDSRSIERVLVKTVR
jgi:hypothetical protein